MSTSTAASRRAGSARRRQRRGRTARAGSRPRPLLHSPARGGEMKQLARWCGRGHVVGFLVALAASGCGRIGYDPLSPLDAGRRYRRGDGRRGRRRRPGGGGRRRRPRGGGAAGAAGAAGAGGGAAQRAGGQWVRGGRGGGAGGRGGVRAAAPRAQRARAVRRNRRRLPGRRSRHGVIPVPTPDTRISFATRSSTGRPRAPRVRAAGFAWPASTTTRKTPG